MVFAGADFPASGLWDMLIHSLS
uniref:Uncharacterized protein n=1 Tax=Anguilla anguilla TaxID=7936 RepID=A0A0E9QFZ3_ANGAN